MRHDFPWLGHGFVHAVEEDYADRFAEELRVRGFDVWTLRGRHMLDEVGFWAEIRRCFEFPDYQGSNWDAFNDSFGDLSLPGRFAIMWRAADETAAKNLKLFAEAIAVFVSACEAVRENGHQGELILTGNGASFTQP